MRAAVAIVGVVLSTSACDEAPRKVETSSAPPEWTQAFDDTCPAPDIDTSAWKLVEGHSISFKVPPDYSDGPGIPIDTEGVDLESGGRTIGYCVPCAPFAAVDERSIPCRDEIDSHEAFIVFTSTRVVDGRYFAGASFKVEKGYLTFGGWSPDLEGQQIVLASVRTIRFKKGSK